MDRVPKKCTSRIQEGKPIPKSYTKEYYNDKVKQFRLKKLHENPLKENKYAFVLHLDDKKFLFKKKNSIDIRKIETDSINLKDFIVCI